MKTHYRYYHGTLGDITYLDAINRAANDLYNERYPEKALPFIYSYFKFIDFHFEIISGENLSPALSPTEKIISNDNFPKMTYPYNYTDSMIYVPDSESRFGNIPRIEYGTQISSMDLDHVVDTGRSTIVMARVSFLLKETLRKPENEKYVKEISKIIFPDYLDMSILDSDPAKSASFVASIESVIKHFTSDTIEKTEEQKETIEWFTKTIQHLNSIVVMELNPLHTFFHNKIGYIAFSFDYGDTERDDCMKEYLASLWQFYKDMKSLNANASFTSMEDLIHYLLKQLTSDLNSDEELE